MNLLPNELAQKIPVLYASELKPNAEKMAYVKFFHPMNSWTWYVLEYDGYDECFGIVIGHMGSEPRWMQPYSLAFCGIHKRTADGWADAPRNLATALDTLSTATYRGIGVTLATAGIPGTGYSGLRGGASPEAIKAVLEEYPLDVTVYQDNASGDRAKVLVADPTPFTGEL